MEVKLIASGVVLVLAAGLAGYAVGNTNSNNDHPTSDASKTASLQEQKQQEAASIAEEKQRIDDATSVIKAQREFDAREKPVIFARLKPQIAAASTMDGKLLVIVTDYCTNFFSFPLDGLGWISSGHEQLYKQYWRATATVSLDANLYRTAGKYCPGSVPDMYKH